MAWKVKVYTYNKPEEEEIFRSYWEAASGAEQVNSMQPQDCENLAVVVECDDKGQEL